MMIEFLYTHPINQYEIEMANFMMLKVIYIQGQNFLTKTRNVLSKLDYSTDIITINDDLTMKEKEQL